MMLLENIRLALNGLKSNKMRALLTMLGIIIGIASVIAIMTVGNSLTVELNKEFDSMGASNIEVMVTRKINEEDYSYDGSGMSYTTVTSYKAPTDSDYIDKDMIREYLDAFEDKVYVIAANEDVGSTQIKEGNLYANVSVTGINYGWIHANKLEVIEGHNFADGEMRNGSRVCIVSDKLVSNLFDGDNKAAIGQDLHVELDGKSYIFNIGGVYEYKQNTYSFESVSEKDVTTALYIPIRAAKSINHTSNYAQFSVIGNTGVDINQFVTDTEDYFNKYYEHNRDFEVMAYSMNSYMEDMNDMMSKLTLAIAVIAGIALLVGGIGVMNIMLVSITERTREIGTRKALGAPNSSIRIQFIVESIVICLIGGMIGMLLGIAMGYAGIKLMQSEEFAVSIESVIVSISFSMGIGVFFGFYPANKAAKMDPIEALRYE